MRKKRQKGPETRKPSGPKRLAKAKHNFKVSRKKPESQEGKLISNFLRDYPLANETSLASLELLWTFLTWLNKEGYFIIHHGAVVCVPVDKLVRKDLLK